jgi:hypothetical protein
MGFVGNTFVVFIVNLFVFHVHVGFALPGLLGVVILVVTLQAGEEKKGWAQSEAISPQRRKFAEALIECKSVSYQRRH